MENPNSNVSDIPIKKSKKNKILLTTLMVVVITAFLVLGYFYKTEKDNNNQLQNQLNSAKNKLDNSERNPVPKEINETTTPLITEQNTVYKANAGKFTLSLPATYGIVKQHDGSGEGGAATLLLIGKKLGNSGIIHSDNYGRVEVEAFPDSSRSGTFEQRVQAKLQEFGGGSTKQTDTVIDGVNVQVYIVGGLFSNKFLLFIKNDVFYAIKLVNNEAPGVNEDLEEVIKGFKFN